MIRSPEELTTFLGHMFFKTFFRLFIPFVPLCKNINIYLPRSNRWFDLWTTDRTVTVRNFRIPFSVVSSFRIHTHMACFGAPVSVFARLYQPLRQNGDLKGAQQKGMGHCPLSFCCRGIGRQRKHTALIVRQTERLARPVSPLQAYRISFSPKGPLLFALLTVYWSKIVINTIRFAVNGEGLFWFCDI